MHREMKKWHLIQILHEFFDDEFKTDIYNTQSLGLVAKFPQQIVRPVRFQNGQIEYLRTYNGVDSMFILGSNYEKLYGITIDSSDIHSFYDLPVASLNENGVENFYFLISTNVTNALSDRLFYVKDQNDAIVFEAFGKNIKFHKHEDILNVTYQFGNGFSHLATYNINKKEPKIIFDNEDLANASVFSSGPHLAITFDRNSQTGRFYDVTGNISRPVIIDDPLFLYGLRDFTDHLGNEFIYYVTSSDQGPNPVYNTVLLQDEAYFQTIPNSNNTKVSQGENIETKLITLLPFELDAREVYSLMPVRTEDDILNNSVLLYPNPAVDALFISAKEKLADYAIFDALGRLRFNNGMSGQQENIDISSLEAGMYVIVLKNGTKHKLHKSFIVVD